MLKFSSMTVYAIDFLFNWYVTVRVIVIQTKFKYLNFKLFK